jgi:hypothetical protein
MIIMLHLVILYCEAKVYQSIFLEKVFFFFFFVISIRNSIVVHAYMSSTHDAEAGGSCKHRSFRPA